MLRWTDRPDGSAAPLIDGVPTVPRAATLIGATMLLVALIIPIRLLPSSGLTGLQVAVMIAAAILGLVMVTVSRIRSPWVAVGGLAVLDVVPVVLVYSTQAPAAQRTMLIWLVVPTVIAATHRVKAIWLTQTAVAAVLVAGVITATTGADQPRSALEACYAAGVLVLAAVVVHRLADSTRDTAAQLWRTSLTDGLTGVLNRRGLVSGFPALVRQAERARTAIGVVLLDVDHFKSINDEYGHAVGDRVLQDLCELVDSVIRPTGLLARTGGEELAAVIAGSPVEVADGLRSAIAASGITPSITVSIGVVEVAPDALRGDPDLLWALLDGADRALYRAKQDGRDLVRVGSADLDGYQAADLMPLPAAALPEPHRPASSGDAALYGCAMMFFAAIAVLARFATDDAVQPGAAADVLLVGSGAAVLIGAWLLVRRPVIATSWLLVGAVFADLLIVCAIVASTDTPGRRMAVYIAIIPALLISLYLTRPVIVGHYAFVLVLVALGAATPGITPLLYFGAVLSAASIIIGCSEMMYRLRSRHDVIAASLHAWSVTDPLTGAANRRGLEMSFARSDRTQPQRILVLDVDDFKAVNDRLGHLAGDDALARLTLALRVVCPAGSIVARTGGDEFVVVSSGYDDGTAERIRGAAALLPVPLSVTVGAVQSVPGSDTDIWDLVTLADMQLTGLKQVKRRRLSAGPPG